MCTNKTLYQPSEEPMRVTEGRGKRRRRKMSFEQVMRTTDCLRLLGNRLEMSIISVSRLLEAKNLYPKLYSLVIGQPELSKVQLANRMQKLLQEA